MKTKKLKRFVCLLLAVVVLLAMPLNTQAHAVALESWVMYAIITGLTAMGITFTVTGGVDAMIQAMEEKVDEYQKQGEIIDFYDIVRSGIKLVPSPSGGTDPDGNQLRNLFFNALAWDALDKFVDWLTSDGGWNLGSTVNYNQQSYFFEKYDNSTSTSEMIESSKVISDGNETTYIINNLLVGTNSYSTAPIVKLTSTDSFRFFKAAYSGSSYSYKIDFNGQQIVQIIGDSDIYKWSLAYDSSEKIGNYYENHFYGLLVNENNEVKYSRDFIAKTSNPIEYIELSSHVDMITPEELEKQFPEVNQGVIMQQLQIGSPEIKEWARQVEELFIETGTIPQPQPQVITDPATQPVPTPAPTTPPIQDVDDLGLPTLGEAVFNKFPFSLPRDLKRIAEILNAEPVTPYWEVDLFAPLADDISFAGDTTLRIDLTEYEALGQISRWASVIGFCIMLIIITKGVIKW